MARQTLRQRLNSLYAALGLNLRDNDPNGPVVQAEAMRAIEAYRECERSGAVAHVERAESVMWGSAVRSMR